MWYFPVTSLIQCFMHRPFHLIVMLLKIRIFQQLRNKRTNTLGIYHIDIRQACLQRIPTSNINQLLGFTCVDWSWSKSSPRASVPWERSLYGHVLKARLSVGNSGCLNFVITWPAATHLQLPGYGYSYFLFEIGGCKTMPCPYCNNELIWERFI